MAPTDIKSGCDPKMKPISRKARRAGKRIKEELNDYIASFFVFRDKQPDKQGKEVADRLDLLNDRWHRFAYKWANNREKIKKSDYIKPNKLAFIKKARELIELVEKEEKK